MPFDFEGKCLFPPVSNDMPLEEKVDALVEGLEYCSAVAGSHDCPTGDFELAAEVIKLIPALFSKIEHGSAEHRAWLKEVIENHFSGLPTPEHKQ